MPEPANNVKAGEVLRTNTVSQSQPSKQGSGKTSTGEGLKENRQFTYSNVDMTHGGKESGAVASSQQDSRVEPAKSEAYHHENPSISIKAKRNLELSLVLTASQMAVETEDTLSARVSGFNDICEWVNVHSDDEGLYSDLLEVETGKERVQEVRATQLHKDKKQMDEKEGATTGQPLEPVSKSKLCS